MVTPAEVNALFAFSRKSRPIFCTLSLSFPLLLQVGTWMFRLWITNLLVIVRHTGWSQVTEPECTVIPPPLVGPLRYALLKISLPLFLFAPSIFPRKNWGEDGEGQMQGCPKECRNWVAAVKHKNEALWSFILSILISSFFAEPFFSSFLLGRGKTMSQKVLVCS